MFNRIKRAFKRPANPAGNVYYARLMTPQGALYKLGYTTKKNLIERMSYGGNGDEKMIDKVFFFTYCDDAWDIEQTLLDHFDKKRAFGKYSKDSSKPLYGRGQSELFHEDILGLDDDLYPQLTEEENSLVQDGCLSLFIALVLIPFTLGLSLLFFIYWIASAQEFSKKTKSNSKRPSHPPKVKYLIDYLTL